MTPHDLNLVVEVERLLRGITDPAYRALFVETVMVIAVILERNQELSFTEVVDFRLVIQNAIKDFAIMHHIAWWVFVFSFCRTLFYRFLQSLLENEWPWFGYRSIVIFSLTITTFSSFGTWWRLIVRETFDSQDNWDKWRRYSYSNLLNVTNIYSKWLSTRVSQYLENYLRFL